MNSLNLGGCAFVACAAYALLAAAAAVEYNPVPHYLCAEIEILRV